MMSEKLKEFKRKGLHRFVISEQLNGITLENVKALIHISEPFLKGDMIADIPSNGPFPEITEAHLDYGTLNIDLVVVLKNGCSIPDMTGIELGTLVVPKYVMYIKENGKRLEEFECGVHHVPWLAENWKNELEDDMLRMLHNYSAINGMPITEYPFDENGKRMDAQPSDEGKCADECEQDDDRTYEVTEWCPNCENENVLIWNTDVEGYAAYCPHCGQKMMLCDECKHSEDNPTGYCDWDEENGCFRENQNKLRLTPFRFTVDAKIRVPANFSRTQAIYYLCAHPDLMDEAIKTGHVVEAK